MPPIHNVLILPSSIRSASGAPRSSREGFSLVEVTLALGIAAFCLVALFGLLPTGLNIIHKGAEEAAALDRASALLADVRTTPVLDAQGNPVTVTTRYGLDLTGGSNAAAAPPEILLDEQGNKSTSGADATARYRIGYRISAPLPNSPQGTRVYLRVSWPATAAAGYSQGLVEISSMVNRND